MAGVFLAGIVLVFIAQNSHEVAIELFWMAFALPLAFIVLAAGLLGVVAGWLAASLRRKPEQVSAPAEVHQLERRQDAYRPDDRGAL